MYDYHPDLVCILFLRLYFTFLGNVFYFLLFNNIPREHNVYMLDNPTYNDQTYSSDVNLKP